MEEWRRWSPVCVVGYGAELDKKVWKERHLKRWGGARLDANAYEDEEEHPVVEADMESGLVLIRGYWDTVGGDKFVSLLLDKSTLRFWYSTGGEVLNSEELYTDLVEPTAAEKESMDEKIRLAIHRMTRGCYPEYSTSLQILATDLNSRYSRNGSHGHEMKIHVHYGMRIDRGRRNIKAMRRSLRAYQPPSLVSKAMRVHAKNGGLGPTANAATRLWAEWLLPGLDLDTPSRHAAYYYLLEDSDVTDDRSITEQAAEFAADYDENLSVEQLQFDRAEFRTLCEWNEDAFPGYWMVRPTTRDYLDAKSETPGAPYTRVERCIARVEKLSDEEEEEDREGDDMEGGKTLEAFHIAVANAKGVGHCFEYDMGVLEISEFEDRQLFAWVEDESIGHLDLGVANPLDDYGDHADDENHDLYRLVEDMGFDVEGPPRLRLLIYIHSW